jgi:hypothetical protein
VNLKRNANLSLISIAKIDPNPEIHYQLYKLYFESVIAETVVSVKSMTKWKTAKNPENWKPVTEFVKDRTRKTQKTQKIDSMRIENLRTTIVSQTKNIIEFSQLEFCKNALASLVKQTPDHAFYVYTLFHLKKRLSAN